jgi:hypothetical protein
LHIWSFSWFEDDRNFQSNLPASVVNETKDNPGLITLPVTGVPATVTILGIN